ncbi:MAG: AarF/ABC1/UbiB kinase family protein [Thermoplasmata archaeon]|nr:MAG: AarF/ABC1/UbiB kinase family protein [Thermoplasmata archaeon]
MNSISDRIVDRELGGDSDGKRERIIGRRLREGYAHYKRYLEILNIVSKHGFGYLFERIKSVNIIPRLEGTREDLKTYSEAVRLRLMFEELGPTFIKIGQILSTRPDLVPEEYVRELESLKDDVKPMPYSDVSAIVEKELGKPINAAFTSFGKQPIGSASIGQVHKAKTKQGKLVAVKVQRSNVKKKIMVDMEIFEDLADMFGSLTGISEVIDPQELVKELKRLLVRELDYTIEARSIEHFRSDFSGVKEVYIPGVYWELTTARVLTMDFVSGIPIDDITGLKKAGIDTGKVAVNLGTAVARMIFVKGYFHGDPHGGNVMVQAGGNIALLDFGSVGYIDGRMRDKVRLFYFSISKEHVEKATELFLEICKVSESAVNRPALEQDFREFLDFQKLRRQGVPITPGMNQNIVSIALKHNFAPPTTFILLERALLEADGVARALSANFDINEMLRPILGDVIKEKIDEALDPIAALQRAQEYRELMRKGPKKVSSVLDKLDSGELVIKMETDIASEIRTDLWRIVGVMGVSIMAMTLLIMITITGITLEIPIINLSLTTVPIIILWIIALWWIMRRWKGPR